MYWWVDPHRSAAMARQDKGKSWVEPFLKPRDVDLRYLGQGPQGDQSTSSEEGPLIPKQNAPSKQTTTSKQDTGNYCAASRESDRTIHDNEADLNDCSNKDCRHTKCSKCHLSQKWWLLSWFSDMERVREMRAEALEGGSLPICVHLLCWVDSGGDCGVRWEVHALLEDSYPCWDSHACI